MFLAASYGAPSIVHPSLFFQWLTSGKLLTTDKFFIPSFESSLMYFDPEPKERREDLYDFEKEYKELKEAIEVRENRCDKGSEKDRENELNEGGLPRVERSECLY